MNDVVMKERSISEVEQAHANKRLPRALRIVAEVEPIAFLPVDRDDDRSLRVLVVGDDRVSTDRLSSLVAGWGHDVRRAYSGLTGLALAAAYRPDVILLDIVMPGVSGIEVALQVRRQDRLKHCFIIAITGPTHAKHRRRSYRAGVDLLLPKPIAPSHIQTLMMLESKRVRQLKRGLIVSSSRSEFSATY